MGKHKKRNSDAEAQPPEEAEEDAPAATDKAQEAEATPGEARGGQQQPQQRMKRSYDEQLNYVTPIASPMAPQKTNRKLLKLIRRAKRAKLVHQGVKLIPKMILKKKHKGIVVIAGDVTPIDVVSHLPVMLEEQGIPYCYSPSKREIGAACGSRRGIALVFLQRHEDFGELYDKMHTKLQELPLPIA